MERAGRTETLVNNCKTLNLNCTGVLATKGTRQNVKYVKDVSFVDQLSSVQPVSNVHTFAQNLKVGARLNQFFENLGHRRPSYKVTRVLREGYTLPFQN